MKVRERIHRRSEFKSDKFVIYDPEVGRVNASVSDFVGEKRDGTKGVRDDHPAMEYEVVGEQVDDKIF